MTDATPESIFTTDDHCEDDGVGVEVSIAVDRAGLVTSVAIIDDTNQEMVELAPEVALAAAKRIVERLEGRVGKSQRSLH
jgi:F420-0:gamma-glutamyl ligase